MHHAVEWMALDPLDVQEDEWRQNLNKYAWVCQANGRHFPDDEAGQAQYLADLLSVKSTSNCDDFTAHWENPTMLDPATRTNINRGSWI